MISTTDLELDAAAPSVVGGARAGARRLAFGRLLLGTSLVLGCVAVIMSALAANAPAAAAPTHRDAMFVVVTATAILHAVVGAAALICGLVAAGRGARGARHADRPA
jgi:hypothetical protein